MSFVIAKAQKPYLFCCQNTNPGPGDYFDKCNNGVFMQQPAPFNSSSIKKSAFQVQDSKNGPGSYQDGQVKKNLANKRVKMTSAFISRVDRFSNSQNSKDVECSQALSLANFKYFNIKGTNNKQTHEMVHSKQLLQQLRNLNRSRRVQSIQDNKEYVRIVLTSPQITENVQSLYVQKSLKKKSHGPGSYELRPKSNSKCVVSWDKLQQKRFQKIDKSDQPGPGSYHHNYDNKISKNNTSSFSYKGIRSYMDTVIYQTNIPFKMQIIKERNLKARQPGPGAYQIKPIKENFNAKQSKFGSHRQRFNTTTQGLIEPGPGYYSSALQQYNLKNTLKQTRKKIFGHQTQTKVNKQVSLMQLMEKRLVVSQKIQNLSSRNYYSLKQRCSSKLGSLGQQARFKTQKETNPGPADYNSTLKNTSKTHAIIKSPNYKQCKQTPSQQFYDIDNNDIGKKVQKIKNNIDEFAKINMQKAPFNSLIQRFPQKKMEVQCVDIFQKQNKKKCKISVTKPIVNSCFKSTSKRQLFKLQTKPGPGQYNKKSKSLQKHSFNNNYNYQMPIKRKVIQRVKGIIQ